ncbi:unnamed protein product [Cladocopium goreaui]|uniref:PDZ domain-containing protein n=1 Tax=Cladocopium goreaui TaxID=2562237 RepID=A0A9P1DCZ0_9DINO|nr:unnamed protein product [Cladocopium goreaui]
MRVPGAAAAADKATTPARPLTATSRGATSSKVVVRAKTPYPIPGDVGYYQRADVKGRIKKPKLDKDMAKLKVAVADLFAYCEAANFREVRAMVSHYPYLLGLTDAHGFSALHHAVMSGEPVFISKVLQLYRDPKTFSLKNLIYTTEEELLNDMELGVQVVGHKSAEDTEALVVAVPLGSRAEEAGLMPGDRLEACSGTGFLSYRQPPPLNKNILESLRSKYVSTSFGFPVTLEFRGNAAMEILAKDGWTPTHGAAGRGAHGDKQIMWQLLGEEDDFSAGWWLGRRSNRRALSAGPCGGKRKPAKKAPKTTKLVLAPSSQDAEEIVRSAKDLSAAPAPCVSHPLEGVDREERVVTSDGIGATARDLALLLSKSLQVSPAPAPPVKALPSSASLKVPAVRRP